MTPDVHKPLDKPRRRAARWRGSPRCGPVLGLPRGARQLHRRRTRVADQGPAPTPGHDRGRAQRQEAAPARPRRLRVVVAGQGTRPMSRVCGCGCGDDLPPNASEQQLYLTGHRQRVYSRRRSARVREALAAMDARTSVKTTATAAATDRRRRIRKPRQTRYLLLRQDGPTLTITGAIVAASKRAAEKRVGQQPDTIVLAASHLPTIAA